ncbi:MAG: hypothetical protein ACKVH6_11340 [Enterobacterales bacterium]|jgi:hypothetical protein|nr:hypothetical protein [Pseudoalteromonas sp. SG43-3]MBB1443550.1 hypothetical protein [Pseudoalteromonas sp. SG43-3]
MVNMIIGLLCALAGGYMGHYFTVKMFNDRVKAQNKALYDEFEIIKDMFASHIKGLLDDFDSNLKSKYSGLRKLDMSFVNSLLLELAASKDIPSKEVRLLIKNLNQVSANLSEKIYSRESKIEEWFNAPLNIEPKDRFAFKSSIQFHTGGLLLVAIDVIYHTSKVLRDRNHFQFNSPSHIEFAEVACKVSGIYFDKQVWERIVSGSLLGTK